MDKISKKQAFLILIVVLIAFSVPVSILAFRFFSEPKVTFVNNSNNFVLKSFNKPKELVNCLNEVMKKYPDSFENNDPIRNLEFEILEDQDLFNKASVDGEFWYSASAIENEKDLARIKIYVSPAYSGVLDNKKLIIINHMMYYSVEDQLTGKPYHTCLGKMAENVRNIDDAPNLIVEDK